jgi:hypothetical protein
MAEFEDGYLGKIDAKTLRVTWFSLPSPHGRARRRKTIVKIAKRHHFDQMRRIEQQRALIAKLERDDLDTIFGGFCGSGHFT